MRMLFNKSRIRVLSLENLTYNIQFQPKTPPQQTFDAAEQQVLSFSIDATQLSGHRSSFPVLYAE